MTNFKSSSEKRAVRSELQRLTSSLIADMGFPGVRVHAVTVKCLEAPGFGYEGERSAFIIRIASDAASRLRGSRAVYKGGYRERIEAVLEHHLRRSGEAGTVRVEFTGSEGSLDAMIALDELVAARKADAGAPLVRTAVRWGIECALVHGRHLIGPSPALAHLVERITNRNAVGSVLELFAGTGIVSTIAEAAGVPRITAIEEDPDKVARLRRRLARTTVTTADATRYVVSGNHHLVTADPYYEDALVFLDAQGPAIREHCRCFLFASGGTSDLQWAREVRRALAALDFRITRHSLYGQVVFECLAS